MTKVPRATVTAPRAVAAAPRATRKIRAPWDFTAFVVKLVVVLGVAAGAAFAVKASREPGATPVSAVAKNQPSSAPAASLVVEAVPLPAESPAPGAGPASAPGMPAAPMASTGTSPSAPAAAESSPTPAAYPGLPAITLSSAVRAGDADRRQLLRAAQWAVDTGGWSRHATALNEAIGRAAATGSSMQYAGNLGAMLTQPTASLAVEQAKFIRAITPSALDAFSKEESSSDFIAWLFVRPAVLAAFTETVQPADRKLEALRRWLNIWNDDEDSRDSLSSLAIACALVFDEPVHISKNVFGFGPETSEYGDEPVKSAGTTEATALARFKFYRESAKRGTLRTPLTEMMPWELVWVVDAPVPESELLWAQKHLQFSRREWGKAYPHIRYRMDRATQGVNPYKAYTLSEIEKEGGICGDQAYFAAISAKAVGIPAMVITGVGDAGGHAWFGYEEARNHWNLTTGRYNSHFAAGTTRVPQTGAIIKEHELKQLTDPARRTADYEKSDRLLALGLLLEDAGQHAVASAATAEALRSAPKNYQAWQAHMVSLAADKTPPEEWLRESARMRATFHEYTDLVAEIQGREAAYVKSHEGDDAERDLVHQQTARLGRKDKERTDLILDGVFREAELAQQSGDNESVGRIYRDALREKGAEVEGFKKIATHYYNWAKTNGQAPETVRELVSYFDRKHPEPHKDVFSMGAYDGALKELTGMAKEQSLESLEKRLTTREEKLVLEKEKLGKAQSKGADK